MMKRILLVIAAYVAVWSGVEAQTIIDPSVKSKTTFAIVVDETSYKEAKSEIEAYRGSVESEGLGTYIIVDDWESPTPIREILKKLHADKKSPLEGCVLIGDVPIAMIRDAQHLCSAFKMRQTRYPWHRSSVPSDRYYDDFGLEFDYLKQDSLRTSYHYYSLTKDSRQYISPDIYSGRIRPLELDGVNRYAMLRDFLRKIVSDKKENTENPFDKLSVARGHGYNSEDMVAWSGEHLALREQLPQLFNPGGTVKFYDFGFSFPAKNLYLNEVQQKDLDVMLFHHHGGVDAQYLNGYKSANSVQDNIENIKLYVRSKVPSMAKKKGREEAVDYYAKTLDIPRSWCEEAFDSVKIAGDSVFNYHLDVHTDDVRNIVPNARFIVFDACFNGSFHQKDNLSGSYIFSRGKTVATQANSVNTIQDKWPDEFLGLLAAGMRVGHFNRLNCFLETHIIGDPTMRFANTSGETKDINELLVLKARDVSFWKKQLEHPMPDMRALALRQLSNADYAGLPELLQETYFGSGSYVVRLEAMRLLALNYPLQSVMVLKAALNDSYELVRRFAGEYVERNGAEELMPDWVNGYLQRHHEKRFRFKLVAGIDAFDYEKTKAEVYRQAAKYDLYNRDVIEKLVNQIDNSAKSAVSDMEIINDPKSKSSWIYTEISRYRNHPVKKGVGMLVDFVKDDSRPMELRIVAAETLGWYTMYHDKSGIVAQLENYDSGVDALNYELAKTIKRLGSKNR
ncbi:MAG: HEAT repeat domain-containing protein [Muribaculaceae bacterium]|nr:HEAT repeat domain-containing protein [Muribaculaceae bacterium]